MNPRARRAAWLAGWLALTVALTLALRQLPWAHVAAQLAHQRVGWALVAMLLNLAILPLWAAEWVRLAPVDERPSWRRTLGVVAVTSATLNTVPFFAGEATAVVLLVARAGLSRAGALAVLALDQLLVGVAKLATIGAAALVAPMPAWIRGGVGALAAFVLLGGAALLLLARGRWRHVPLLARASAWTRHLAALRDVRTAAIVVMLALLKKTAEVMAILATQQALGIVLPWWSGVLVVAALGVGTLLPVAPGNLGTYEATCVVVYRSLGLPLEAALGLALVQHLYFLVPSIGAGWLVMTARQLRLGTAPREEAAPATRS